LRGYPVSAAHRDVAYRQQQLFAEYSPGAKRTALILVASGSGNVPYTHLLPRARYNRILWHLAYAPPGQDKTLPPHDFVFNAVGDPDAADVALKAAAHYIDHCGMPVINRPECVARTTRSNMPALLEGVQGLVMPGTVLIDRSAGDPAAAILASGLAFPLILRPAGRHGGEGAQLVRSPGELAARIPARDCFYATEFIDYRSPDGWHRKYRVIFVDREPYPYHLAIGARWLLHYRTADMADDAALRIEELDFLRNPAAALGSRAMAALRQIAARLDLDYAGIDFSLLPDGRLLFFEANPTMLVHPESDPVFTYKNDAVDAIVAAIETMIAGRLATRNSSSGKDAR
jgi:glutathione synthase/RimK-type ligase-like ATP-grasp enzyme